MKRNFWQGMIYASQLGLSLVAPPVGLSLLALWAQQHFGAGLWAPVVALVLGGGMSIATALSFFRVFLQIGRTEMKDKER